MFRGELFSIYRLTAVTSEDPDVDVAGKRSYQDTNEDITGQLEPVDVEFGGLGEGAFGKSFKFRSDDTASTLTEGDRLYDGTNYYEVKGVQRYARGVKHLQALVEKVIKQ